MNTQFYCLRKRVFFALFLAVLFSGCRTEKGWEPLYSGSICKDYENRRCTLSTDDPFYGINVQLISNYSGSKIYLDTENMQFPYIGDARDQTLVSYSVDDKNYTVQADRLQGGQRLLLPSESKDTIVSALRSGKTVGITIGAYHAMLPPM